ncbi:MAG: carbohydrate porin [Cyanobacteriota bacterium]|nr:carbohydrate porin [Cyanobacteriota bacterium]
MPTGKNNIGRNEPLRLRRIAAAVVCMVCSPSAAARKRTVLALLIGAATSIPAGVPFPAAAPALAAPPASISSESTDSRSAPAAAPETAGGNPINAIQFLGTGELGQWLGLPADGALRIGGVGVINATGQWQGGAPDGADSAGGFLAVGASLDLEKAVGWKGAKLAVAGLQYNVQPTNANAGSLQGIVSSDAAGPNTRTELYNYLFVQNLFDDQLQVIAGKLIPTIAFGNATAPAPLAQSGSDWVPTLTSLLYTPVFVVPTMLGRIPGYPDSALGFGVSVAPQALPGTYLSGGVFDGRLGANGTPTGLVAPSLSGPLFSIAQVGTFWRVGAQGKPGQFFLGAWNQGGPLQVGSVRETSAWGIYGQVSQRLSHFRLGRDSSGLNVFVQAGWSPSTTNLINSSLGGGVTLWAPFASRPKDSYGLGLSWAAPNSDPASFGFNGSELILQAYAQVHLVGGLFLQPTVSLLPRVGLPEASAPSLSGTLQLTALF